MVDSHNAADGHVLLEVTAVLSTLPFNHGRLEEIPQILSCTVTSIYRHCHTLYERRTMLSAQTYQHSPRQWGSDQSLAGSCSRRTRRC